MMSKILYEFERKKILIINSLITNEFRNKKILLIINSLLIN